MKGIKGSDTRIEITFLPFLCFASIIGRCSIRNISSASLLRNAPVSPGEQRAGVHLLILTRSNCQFALLSRGAVKTIRASRRLFANKPRARAFISPPGGNPFPLFVQSSRSKAFKVISVNWREKNWPIVDDTIGLVSYRWVRFIDQVHDRGTGRGIGYAEIAPSLFGDDGLNGKRFDIKGIKFNRKNNIITFILYSLIIYIYW